MNTVFAINFRREAYQRELARTRRRLFKLGGWLTYFGVLALVLGLYALNGVALVRRVQITERRVARTQTSGQRTDWKLSGRALTMVQDARANPAQWRDRLARLAAILPPNVALSSVAVNPDNLPGLADQNRLVLTGEMRVPSGSDRIRPVGQLVPLLQADSTFARGYSSIRVTKNQIVPGSSTLTEFEIECRR